ncbi:MAG: lactate utilization protein [Candidatus Omnitrophica bacterium]|nr:lactate utilization protein [Candidatus Omnitrophota bacterium]
MEQEIKTIIGNWQKRNISGIFTNDITEARGRVLSAIPLAASVGISGSVTLDQLEIVKHLELRGNKVFNQYRPGITREESLELRNKGSQADYYLTSANALSLSGELIFLSAYGNRIAGISSAKNVIVVCGINKITPNVEAALKRAREYATPLNCKRLNWPSYCLKEGVCNPEVCLPSDYKRMCCQVLIIEAEVVPGRLKVILVGEKLGF